MEQILLFIAELIDEVVKGRRWWVRCLVVFICGACVSSALWLVRGFNDGVASRHDGWTAVLLHVGIGVGAVLLYWICQLWRVWRSLPGSNR